MEKLKTTRFVRKPLYVKAIQVTAENMGDIADWSHGEIQEDHGRTFIKVDVPRAAYERQTKAYVGDWVLYAGTTFKVFTQKAFKEAFDEAPEDDNVLLEAIA